MDQNSDEDDDIVTEGEDEESENNQDSYSVAQDFGSDFTKDENVDDGNEGFDQEIDRTDQESTVSSEGFPAPGENDDPFRVQSLTTSAGNSDGNYQEVTRLFPPPPSSSPEKTNDVSTVTIKASDNKSKAPPKSTVSLKKKKTNKGTFKGKPFKILKAPKPPSNGSEEALDMEEERLKMLPDCCEFTVRKNEAFEIDEGRKEMSSAWFSQVKLTPEQQKKLCFSESLLMVEETGAVVGKYYTTISNSKWNDKPCLCVHSGSFGKFSTGLESGTSITSFINYNLKPLQEFVHEWATINSDTIERKTFVMKEMDGFPCKITLIRNGKIVDTKPFALGLKDRENLITEGINILLQRLLILERRTTGSMIVQSLSYTGKVVRTKYSELGSGWENVKGKQMKTWGIRRNVYVSEDEERVWDSLFNKNSRLILRCQPDSPQALIPLWYESIIDFDKNGNFIGSYSPYAWACDVELYSKYTIKKEELTHDHRRYILDHPEVRALLSDYLQAILFRKPQNVIEFTKNYFESFLNLKGVKPGSRPQTKKMVQETSSSRASSNFLDGSSISVMAEATLEEGEWLGEGEDSSNFYSVNPTVNYDGLEQVDDNNVATDKSDMQTTENEETEDDLEVDERGQYVRKSSNFSN